MRIYIDRRELASTYPTDYLRKIKRGRYGNYSSSGNVNYSEKATFEQGFAVEDLTSEQIEVIHKEARAKREKTMEKEIALKLSERALQVEACLKGEALPVENNPHASPFTKLVNLKGSFLDVYAGCGKGTAYIRDNSLIAYHYGYTKPSNAPKDCQILQIELSATQILI